MYLFAILSGKASLQRLHISVLALHWN